MKSLESLAPLLLAWYDTVHANRAMPWRQTRDPYAIWLSETMLQQTQVETVKPYYERFLKRFPTVNDLAAAPLDDVLALWAGLGYYRRAKHLHQAAQQVAAECAGRLPETVEGLQELPGIGRYTAGAIASIAFGAAAPVVDGNVLRVLARITGCTLDIAAPKNHGIFWEYAERVIAGSAQQKNEPATPAAARYGDVNQALMELGATICVPPPAKPACLLCPLKQSCVAFAQGRQMELPVKSKRKATPVVRGVAAVVRHEKKGRIQVLLMKRPAGGLWEHMWEFPVLPSPKASARKNCNWPAWLTSKLGMNLATVEGPRRGQTVKHQLTHRQLIYEVAVASAKGTALPRKAVECLGTKRVYEEARWVEWPLGDTLAVAELVRKVGRVLE